MALQRRQFLLLLVPPALGPGQRLAVAAQPHLSPQQGCIQFPHFRWRVAVVSGVGGHGGEVHGHRITGEQLQVAGGAAIPQEQQLPGAPQQGALQRWIAPQHLG